MTIEMVGNIYRITRTTQKYVVSVYIRARDSQKAIAKFNKRVLKYECSKCKMVSVKPLPEKVKDLPKIITVEKIEVLE